jgi:MFS family permease
MEKSANRHIESVWLAQSFLDDFILIYPVYAIMMLETGVTGLELSVLFAIWSLSALLFEIPSGVIGDLVNRKRYVAIGSLVRAAGYLMWLVYPEVPGFALGFLLWSLGSAIHSGTMQSLLHDVLADQGRPEAFARIFGRGKAMESVGVLVAMTIGGFLAAEGYSEVLLLSALAPVLGAVLVLGYVSEPPRSHPVEDEAFTTTLGLALKTLLGNRVLLMIAAMLILLMGASGVVDEYLGPLFDAPGELSLGMIGVLYGGVLGARALGAALAHRLRDFSLRWIAGLSVLAHILLFWAMQGNLLWLVVGCAVYFAAMGIVEVLLETHLQQQIEVHARATITSVAGAGLEIWGIALFLLIGFRADAGDWTTAIGSVALLAVVISILLTYAAGPVSARIRS